MKRILYKPIAIEILVVFASIILSGCSQSVSSNGANVAFPDKNVSFQNQVLPFIKVTCGLQGCHGDVNPAQDIRLTDYSSIIMAYNGGLIVQKNPDGSVLVQMLENKLPHNPNLYWQITDNQKKGIRQWILEGAMNN